MEIRPYTKTDEAEVHALWQAVFPEESSYIDPDHPMQKKLHTHRNLFLVARTETSVAGVIIGSYDGDHGWMHYLAVWPQYRRLGVASRLTKALESELKHLGCQSIRLQVNSLHDDVVQFYQNQGYHLSQTVSLEKGLRIE